MSAVGEATVVWSWSRIFTVGERGLRGTAGREWRRYHANTEVGVLGII